MPGQANQASPRHTGRHTRPPQSTDGDGRVAPGPHMKKFFVTAFASLLVVSAAAFAVPTVQQIESAMAQGNWQQADAGLSEVLQAHPNNARAHYLYAQVLDREGRSA